MKESQLMGPNKELPPFQTRPTNIERGQFQTKNTDQTCPCFYQARGIVGLKNKTGGDYLEAMVLNKEDRRFESSKPSEFEASILRDFYRYLSTEIKNCLYLHHHSADVAKLVDASDLGSGAFGHGGSSPSIRTAMNVKCR